MWATFVHVSGKVNIYSYCLTNSLPTFRPIVHHQSPLKHPFHQLIVTPSTRPKNYPVWSLWHIDRSPKSLFYALRTNFNFSVIHRHCEFASPSANSNTEHSNHFFFIAEDCQHLQFSSQNMIASRFSTYTVITKCLRSSKSKGQVAWLSFFFCRWHSTYKNNNKSFFITYITLLKFVCWEM